MEDLLFKGTDRIGGGYVDMNIWLKFYKIMPIILLLIIVFSVFFLYKSKYKALICTVLVYPLCFLITSVIAFGTQQLIVKPSESMRESKYISYNIEATRNAYGLSDITESEYPLNDSITAQTLEDNSDIIQRFTTAIAKGQKWVMEHSSSEVAECVAEFFADTDISLLESSVENYKKIGAYSLSPIMTKEGFAPYDGEWWHFSYGDKEWAFYYKQDKALYNQVSSTIVYKK
jgi:hypothetical protein